MNPAKPGMRRRGSMAAVLIAVAAFGLIAAVLGITRFVVPPGTQPDASAVELDAQGQPRLQSAPARDLQRLRAREAARLHGYGWVDREAGRVHIPVERAMALLAEEGAERLAGEPWAPQAAAGRQAATSSPAAAQAVTAQRKARTASPGKEVPLPARPEPGAGAGQPPLDVQPRPSLGGPLPPPGEKAP